MDSGNPNLLGQIAVREGLVKPEQIQECIVQQARAGKPMSMGELLVDNGYLTREQLDEILYMQATYFRRLSIETQAKGLFGQIAVQQAYLTGDQLNECLREQEELRARGATSGLGDLLLRKGYLTAEQFLDILRRQNREIVKCPGCPLYYDLTEYRDEERYICTECKTPIPIPKQAR